MRITLYLENQVFGFISYDINVYVEIDLYK